MFLQLVTSRLSTLSRLQLPLRSLTRSLSTTAKDDHSFTRSLSTTTKDDRIDAILDRHMTRREFNNDKVDAVFAEMDSRGQGTITLDQFKHAVKKIEESELSKLSRSVSRNELSRTGSRMGSRGLARSGNLNLSGATAVQAAVPLLFDAVASSPAVAVAVEIDVAEQSKILNLDAAAADGQTLADIIGARISTTAEVAISKIFMAGFGWQSFSIIADTYGFAADSTGFALITGVGDFTGVCVGHTAWMLGKSMMVDDTIDTTAEFHTGLLLGTAAFFSGTTWQPLVNLLHDTLHLSFNTSCGLTMIGCGSAFYIGLRCGRMVLSPFLRGVEATNYANLKADAALSVSVGAATGCFVGTDLSFGNENWMSGVLGIEDTYSNLHGMAIAGSSTAIGFTAVQMMQNVAVRPGYNWVD